MTNGGVGGGKGGGGDGGGARSESSTALSRHAAYVAVESLGGGVPKLFNFVHWPAGDASPRQSCTLPSLCSGHTPAPAPGPCA